MEQQDVLDCLPYDYSSEGTNTNAVSLDKLSFRSMGGDLDPLENLGPQFCILGEICQQGIREKRMK